VKADGFINVDIGPELKERLLATLERQATTQKLGIRRIIETFCAMDEGTQALLLRQVRGEDARALARHLLARIAKKPK
jgi:hypothetical protein